ncbi:MAG: tetratricopeptide repeat protein [Alphaproteobacteria bacterium]
MAWLRWLVIPLGSVALCGCVWFGDLTDEGTDAAPVAEEMAEPAPFRPSTDYDFAGSRALAEAGNADYAAGRMDAAIAQYEAAIARWPANPQAWTGLAAAYRDAGREADKDYALFFARRIEWADSSPAASVAASFRNVAAGRVNRPVEDPRVQTMADQLALYYAGLDVAQRMAQIGSRAEPADVLDAVGFVPALIGTAAMSIYLGAQAAGIFLSE